MITCMPESVGICRRIDEVVERFRLLMQHPVLQSFLLHFMRCLHLTPCHTQVSLVVTHMPVRQCSCESSERVVSCCPSAFAIPVPSNECPSVLMISGQHTYHMPNDLLPMCSYISDRWHSRSVLFSVEKRVTRSFLHRFLLSLRRLLLPFR